MSVVTYEEESGVEESNKVGNPDSLEAAEKLAEASADIKGLVTVFKLLSDETRLRILFILREAEEMNVLELCQILGQRQPSVSHHLALLRVNGLIDMRRDGKHNFYHIRPARLDEVVASVLKVAPGGNGLAAAVENAAAYSVGQAKA